MEHIIEKEPLLYSEEGWDITDDGENRWKVVRPVKWEKRDKYYAIEEQIEQEENEQENV